MTRDPGRPTSNNKQLRYSPDDYLVRLHPDISLYAQSRYVMRRKRLFPRPITIIITLGQSNRRM